MRIFKIRKNEILPALAALTVFVLLNALMINYKYSLFTKGGSVGFWSIFGQNFHVSGFDCNTYMMLSCNRIIYSALRHPLLGAMLWPLAALNQWLMDIYGFNFAVYIMALVLVVCDLYSFIFLYRTLHEVVALRRADSLLLSFWFFSLASIMLTAFVPDHFAMSMFLLNLTLYISGRKMREGRMMSPWQAMLLFLVSAGVTLTNSVKIVLAGLFVGGRRFLRARNVLVAVLFPSAVIAGAYVWQMETVVKADSERARLMEEKRMKSDSRFAKKMMERKKEVDRRREGQLLESQYFEYTDTRVPRLQTVVENLFGESVQLHQQYLLGDVNQKRPLIVRYDSAVNYVVESVLVLLFVAGVFLGCRDRFMRLCLSWFVFDMFLHLVLCFGITEVYIMGAHWMSVIPVSIAYLIKRMPERWLFPARCLVAGLGMYLWVYNGTLIVRYML